jgi:hypothetical protein
VYKNQLYLTRLHRVNKLTENFHAISTKGVGVLERRNTVATRKPDGDCGYNKAQNFRKIVKCFKNKKVVTALIVPNGSFFCKGSLWTT